MHRILSAFFRPCSESLNNKSSSFVNSTSCCLRISWPKWPAFVVSCICQGFSLCKPDICIWYVTMNMQVRSINQSVPRSSLRWQVLSPQHSFEVKYFQSVVQGYMNESCLVCVHISLSIYLRHQKPLVVKNEWLYWWKYHSPHIICIHSVHIFINHFLRRRNRQWRPPRTQGNDMSQPIHVRCNQGYYLHVESKNTSLYEPLVFASALHRLDVGSWSYSMIVLRASWTSMMLPSTLVWPTFSLVSGIGNAPIRIVISLSACHGFHQASDLLYNQSTVFNIDKGSIFQSCWVTTITRSIGIYVRYPFISSAFRWWLPRSRARPNIYI